MDRIRWTEWRQIHLVRRGQQTQPRSWICVEQESKRVPVALQTCDHPRLASKIRRDLTQSIHNSSLCTHGIQHRRRTNIILQDLDECIQDIPRKDILMLIGDWNVKVGSINDDWEVTMGKYGYGKLSDRILHLAPDRITMPASYHSVFYRPDALPATQPTASKHWRHRPSIYTFLFIIVALSVAYWCV